MRAASRHVLGSGLALLEERSMRARAGLPSDRDLDRRFPLPRPHRRGRRPPHSTAWAADPDRLGAPPQTFEAILDWLLDGLETLS
ncbi:hypothetical protein ACFQV8_30615 [Pseudonocardia benzenivorans]